MNQHPQPRKKLPSAPRAHSAACVVLALMLLASWCASAQAQTGNYNRYMQTNAQNSGQGQPGSTTGQTYSGQQIPPYNRPPSVMGQGNYPPAEYSPPQYAPQPAAGNSYGQPQATNPPQGYAAPQSYGQPAPAYSPPVRSQLSGVGGYAPAQYGQYGQPAMVGNQGNAPFVNQQSSGVQINSSSALPAPPPALGYGAPGTYVPQNIAEYQVAPGATASVDPNGGDYSALAPGAVPPGGLPGDSPLGFTTPTPYQPRIREAPIVIYAQEARTGRVILGGSVNSDLGLAGQVIVDERNFDWRRFPTSWADLFGGRAFRGGGQNFRAELMPGTNVQRYTVNFTQPRLFGYSRIGFGVGGFVFTRQFRDWTEERLGGRVALSYDINQSLSLTTELQIQDVQISHPRVLAPELTSVLGSNNLNTFRVRLAHDTRDNVFMATEGHLIELIYDQAFGEFKYPRGQLNFSRYFLIRERTDGGGRHTLAANWKAGITGSDTPIFENFFVGGYSTLRGFSFRGASPKTGDLQVGGKTMLLGSLEYLFPLTADDMLRGLLFVDYGAISKDLNLAWDDYRIAPGFGFRVNVPALGPAPLAFDFAFPVKYNNADDRQVFSFFMGFTR